MGQGLHLKMNSCGYCNVTCMKFDYLTKYASGANYIQNEDESTVSACY